MIGKSWLKFILAIQPFPNSELCASAPAHFLSKSKKLFFNKENLGEKKLTFFFLARFRNVFYVYASTLGVEETSEADDVFNEKAELHSFRDKAKNYENEVRGHEKNWRKVHQKIDISSSQSYAFE